MLKDTTITASRKVVSARTCTMTESEKETELSAQHVMGIGKNITAMPQYFHMDLKTEPNIVNVPDFQEKGHLVALSRSIWQATLF